MVALQTSDGLKYDLKMTQSGAGHLRSFTSPTGYSVDFNYDQNSGLLESKIDSSNLGYLYRYDPYGRLVGAVLPTGESLSLGFNLTSTDGAKVEVRRDGAAWQSVTVQDHRVSAVSLPDAGQRPKTVSIGSDKTVRSFFVIKCILIFVFKF